jgi:hypothetical protein
MFKINEVGLVLIFLAILLIIIIIQAIMFGVFLFTYFKIYDNFWGNSRCYIFLMKINKK